MADKIPARVQIVHERDHILNLHYTDGKEVKVLTLGRSRDRGVEGAVSPDVMVDGETWAKLRSSAPVEALFTSGAIRVYPLAG